ncbi:MAG: hypothetical protein AAB725_00710 [Patescibacteria group bacterium]
MGLGKGKHLSRLGSNQQKILLLLSAGIGLSMAKSPRQYFKVLEEAGWEWKNINERALNSAIRSLYKSRLVREHENPDGSLTMVLTDKGKKKVITFNIDNMTINKPKIWDKKWRMVLFDIPEKHKSAREALRETLRKIGFREYQKSVLIHPYNCQDEVSFVVEYFNVRAYVRLVTATELDNEIHLKKIFSL